MCSKTQTKTHFFHNIVENSEMAGLLLPRPPPHPKSITLPGFRPPRTRKARDTLGDRDLLVVAVYDVKGDLYLGFSQAAGASSVAWLLWTAMRLGQLLPLPYFLLP